jgi:archaellum component FlaD/FlaE/archaellum component FlaC
MSSAVVGSVGAVPTDGSTVTALLVVLSGGLVGMSIREMIGILGDDEGEEASDDELADGGLMADDGEEDLGGFGGLDDGGDEEFDDFGGDDEFGDMDEGSDTDELEHRLDELETEVGSLSSTVNTVRNENEQISETVDDVEENVRKLLDIYEMVTRGVNPFADDMEPGGMAGGDGSFGLFDDGDEGEDEQNLDDDLANADAEGFFDEDLVDDESGPAADADPMGMGSGDAGEDALDAGFEDDGGTFDDAALDEVDDDVGEFDDALDDASGEFDDAGGEFDETFEEDSLDGPDGDGSEDDGGDGEGGKSFAQLKDEYEAGDAEWADEMAAGEDDGSDDDADGDIADELGDADADGDLADELGDADADGDLADELGDADEVLDGSADDAEAAAGNGDLAGDDLFDEVVEDSGDVESGAEAESVTTDLEPVDTDAATDADATTTDTDAGAGADAATDADADAGGATDADAGGATDTDAGGATDTDAGANGDGKPYLAETPEGFAADMIVVEWLEYLVGEVGVRETARAIDYYERIDWVAEPVGEDLRAYLRGFDGEGGEGALTIDHHTQSLRYISQLDGDAGEAVALSGLLGRRGGGSDGLQR